MKEEEELNIQQIRFSNGTEVLANIILWQDDELIEANCILEIDRRTYDNDFDVEENKSYYVLKPWISYIDDMHKMSVINPVSILSVTTPAPIVVEQYTTSLKEIIKYMADTAKPEDNVETELRTDSLNVIPFTPKNNIQLLTED
jgi:hypothetical protein|tara:strand:+ start:1044 stop:1475 length:432 start_codon:yes stop_codon:yes gene_type:complete